MAPPTNAVVLSVDEKPPIQALERAQGYLKLPNGRAMIGQSHDFKRHGTSTLFTALDVGTGQVIGKHYKRRHRLKFRDFMNRVVKQYEGKEIHVILDNLSTHRPKRDLWVAASERAFPLHPDTYVMAELDRNLVLDPGGLVVEWSLVWYGRRTGGSHRKLHQQLRRGYSPVPLDQKRHPPKTAQAMFCGLTILGIRLAIHPASLDGTFGKSRPDVGVPPLHVVAGSSYGSPDLACKAVGRRLRAAIPHRVQLIEVIEVFVEGIVSSHTVACVRASRSGFPRDLG
jgi:hypothetical protein